MSLVALFGRSPDAAVIACVLGILLIYLELNRPGVVLPGAAGLLLVLLSLAGLAYYSLDLAAALCLLAAVAALGWGLRRRTSWIVGAIATAGTVAGCRNLLRAPNGARVHLLTALSAGLILGPGTFLLTAIARRARVNKGLD